MDGIHDLGGLHGFGRVPRGGGAERAFTEDWQRRVFGCVLAAGLTNVDAFRHALERLGPVAYLANGYFGRWLAALERLASGEEARIAGLGPSARVLARPPVFRVGVRVRTRAHGVPGHTRLPRYARGRQGEVVANRGAFVFPDTHAHGQGENPKHVYTVRFEGAELFGESAEPGTCVHLDLFEPYLEAEPVSSPQ